MKTGAQLIKEAVGGEPESSAAGYEDKLEADTERAFSKYSEGGL